MTRYIVRRLLALIPLMIGVSLLVFLAVNFVPGDPVRIMLGIDATEEMVATLRARYGLDQPLPIRYLYWLWNVLQGDMGQSIITGRSVGDEIASRLAVTIQLTALAVAGAVLVAVPLGIASALKRESLVDYALRVLSLVGISLPNFAVGVLLILFTSRVFLWQPPPGFVNVWDDSKTALQILVMPAIALGSGLIGAISRMTRSMMLEVLGQDFMRTARAKGLPESRVVVKHALRNALVPVLTIVGLQVGYLLGGAVVIEEIFSLPGLGRLLLTAISTRDYPVVMGTVLVIAFMFALVNLLVDLLYAVVDPRIRY